jgi:hypothetical protein
MTKRTWRWVARDQDGVKVFAAEDKPVLVANCWWMNSGVNELVEDEDSFKVMTGLTIPTDRPVRVEFSARVIEDDDSAGLVVGVEEVK